MRGRLLRLEIPFEQGTPGEGANLTLEDAASSDSRRPSPGTRLPPFSSERPDEWESYKLLVAPGARSRSRRKLLAEDSLEGLSYSSRPPGAALAFF